MTARVTARGAAARTSQCIAILAGLVFLCALPVGLLVLPIMLLLKQLPLRSAAYIQSTGAAMAEGIEPIEDEDQDGTGVDEPDDDGPRPTAGAPARVGAT